MMQRDNNKGKSRAVRPEKRNNNPPRPAEGSTLSRKVALSALCDVTIGGAYAGQTLSRRLRGSELQEADRRLCTSIFYTALENRLLIDHILGQFVASMPEPAVREILHIAVAQIMFLSRVPDHAAVDQAVRQARALDREYLVPMINGALRNIARARDAGEIQYPDREASPIRYLSIMQSTSEPLVKRLADAYGMDEAERIIAYKPAERYETVRPNLNEFSSGEEFEAYLKARGYDYRPGTVQNAYLIKAGGDITGSPDFKAGRYSVQGEASMLAAYAVEPKPGMHIFDACAAPGGKAALMCELMQGSGRVYAHDLHEHRVELIKAVERRLNLGNLRAAVGDSTRLRQERVETMDAVLIDAPCSGLGVLADKADIKFRLKDEDIDNMIKIQAQLLDVCSTYVKPGGLLVYATCTVLPDENARQVAAFLERNGDFTPDDGVDWLPEMYRDKLAGGMIQFISHIDGGMDGFFIARMRRRR